jgi:hypothetical protein
MWLWMGKEAAVSLRVGSGSLLVLCVDEQLVQVRSQCFDCGGPEDRLEIVVVWFQCVGRVSLVVWDRVDGQPVAHRLGKLLPLFLGFDVVDLFIVEHPIACADVSNDGVSNRNPDPGQISSRGIHDSVEVPTVVEWVLVVPADVAVAAFIDLFVVWLCNNGVHDDCLMGGVFLAFGALSMP